jgi:hypothetical protein
MIGIGRPKGRSPEIVTRPRGPGSTQERGSAPEASGVGDDRPGAGFHIGVGGQLCIAKRDHPHRGTHHPGPALTTWTGRADAAVDRSVSRPRHNRRGGSPGGSVLPGTTARAPTPAMSTTSLATERKPMKDHPGSGDGKMPKRVRNPTFSTITTQPPASAEPTGVPGVRPRRTTPPDGRAPQQNLCRNGRIIRTWAITTINGCRHSIQAEIMLGLEPAGHHPG